MEIGTLVKQRYPIKLYLSSIHQIRTLNFTFDNQIPQAFRMSLRSLLSDMSIDTTGKIKYGKNVKLHFSYDDPAAQTMVVCCTGDAELMLHLEGESTLYTAAWSVYALATGANWFDGSTDCTVNAKTFSLEQQLLAKSLLRGINNHRFGEMSDKEKKSLKETFFKYICQIAKDFAMKAPGFSLLPVPDQRLNDVKRKMLKNVTYLELLRQLDCNIFYLKDMRAYSDMIRQDSEYQEKLKVYVNYLLDDVRYLPMCDIGNVIMSERRSLKQTFDEKYHNAIERLKLKVEEKCSPGFLSAKKFRSLYAGFDEVTRDVAYEKLRLTVLEDLADRFMSIYNERVQEVRRQFTGIMEPNLLYIVADVVPPQKLNWQKLNDYTADSFTVPKHTWDYKNGTLLGDIIMGGYQIAPGYTCTWICGEESGKILDSIIPTGGCVIRGLSNQLLVALMVKHN